MANSTGSMESDLTFEELLCFLVVWKPSHVVWDDKKHKGENLEFLYIYCMQIKLYKANCTDFMSNQETKQSSATDMHIIHFSSFSHMLLNKLEQSIFYKEAFIVFD